MGRVPGGDLVWPDDGFVVRLSRAAQPGRNIVFQLAMRDGDGRWYIKAYFIEPNLAVLISVHRSE